MTDFVLSSNSYMRPFRARNGGAFPIRQMALSTGISSQIIRVGNVVALDMNTTNGWSEITLSSVSSQTLVSTAIVGVAAAGPGAAGGNPSSTNTEGTLMPVWEADPQVEFKAATIGGLLNSTVVGVVKDILRDTTLNIDIINLAASKLTAPMNHVMITGLIDASGDSGGFVSFKFLPRDYTNSTLSSGRRLAFFI